MTDHRQAFDPSTATSFVKNPAGSPHHAYRDAAGSLCLVCEGTSPAGGVPVNEAALDWLREQAGGQFVRLLNRNSKFDLTLELIRLPTKGHAGRQARPLRLL